ncbi:sushi, von Willebrand factor type A, EGF and pentraxin domain-containing protein 1-like isoform X3 [Dreissena polymorpha]|uniref:sushi, von Willebrand factor type A, EGF and pentraxin domain-containing protein 1-like isoform X3 n=1 Tax=Dreissena polymorpha TaxID=45954 RepID=UPI002264C2A8|nr:sushi, von Willebrand factor type A, EGF and pentraxin domain-containing protein 1-like isoform X3 [Dreissena polymorpha]
MFRIAVVLVVTIISFPCVFGTFWLEQKPSNCPSGDNGKHVCSSLLSNNFTCVTFDCCSNFESNASNGVDERHMFDRSHVLQNNPEEFTHCPVCYAKKACTLYQCFHSCCPGFTPDATGVCIAAAADQFCQNGGIQYKDGDMIKCRCQPDFEGSTCDRPVCNCTNGGMCTVQNGRPVCSCPSHYTGRQCEIPTCNIRCLNGGRCVINGNYEMCVCSPDFVGRLCEIPFRQPNTCPPVSSDRLYCEYKCNTNADCGADGVCCREGCSTVCRQTETSCQNGDMMFVVGQSYRPDPCTTCTCMPGGEMPCLAKSCAQPQCSGDTTPVRKPGECCYTCPDNLVETNCKLRDMMFRIGQSYNPDPCTTCRCMPGGEMPCLAKSCAPPQCSGDTTPVRKPGECCYTCPEIEVPKSANPTIMCPRDLLELYVPENGFEVLLDHNTTKVHAKDSIGHELQVTFVPPVARHCFCKDIRKIRVQAWAHDALGNKAFCEFDIVVRDKTPPVFATCPDDIYIFAEEKPCWTRPVPTDNVGIAKYSEIDKVPREVGVHKMSYVATDYDGNFGFCVFLISISGHGTPVADLPQGLKDRSMDDTRMGVSVGIPVGGVILVVGVVALIFYILRRKRSTPQTADTSGVSKPSFDNRMYAIPGRGMVRLPSYKAGMSPPPQYVSTVSLNATFPSNDPPPSYSNSGYMSVGETKQPEEHVYDSIHGEKSIV